ncbi:uncharacterized protein LOC127266334 [Andrographis paniculata]|uniref:uncharacterized protein LOC127266334 n=1 Tax=Andrographis paniculata TaxID=175694 RepID=UPI0021E7B5A1|nr:uncharacterized protein LOC127266334 [Andrographis paniculata]
MDPCPFVRLIAAVNLSGAAASAGAAAGSGGPPCYAKLKINDFPSQTTALLPLSSTGDPPSAVFHLGPEALRRLSARPVVAIKISVFAGRVGRACGVAAAGKLLGGVQVFVNLGDAQARGCVYHNGWVKLDGGEPAAKLHLTVRSEPDPRFVFQFGGEPECSPVVFQIQGKRRQPVFSCKFSADRNHRSRSVPSDFIAAANRTWSRTLSGDRERAGLDRKGWMIIVYDLSGSAVAAASMVTPFVPSPGSDRVSRSNPGAWLILSPAGASVGSWKPWGRLEAWRESGPVDGVGYKFELITDAGLSTGVPIAAGTMSVKKGGKFCIEERRRRGAAAVRVVVPYDRRRGFVMGSSVEGEGKTSKPVVEVGVQHVTCIGDAALFIALSAAVDLSMDACRLFSQKLRKEFCSDEQELLP